MNLNGGPLQAIACEGNLRVCLGQNLGFQNGFHSRWRWESLYTGSKVCSRSSDASFQSTVDLVHLFLYLALGNFQRRE